VFAIDVSQKTSTILSRQTNRIELIAITLHTTIINIYFNFFRLLNIYSFFVFIIILLIIAFTSRISKILFDTRTTFFNQINFEFCQIYSSISIVVFEFSISKFLNIERLSKVITSRTLFIIRKNFVFEKILYK